MNPLDSKLSPETFERLIGRAVEIDDQGNERIDLVRAKEIAAELGVSRTAWDKAFLERTKAGAESGHTEAVKLDAPRIIAAAVAGGIAGTIMGLISAVSTGNDILIGAALIAAALGLAAREYRRHSFSQAQASIAAWWMAAAAGIPIGLQQTTSDTLWYAALSWAGCAVALSVVDLIKRRTREASKAATPTA